MAQNIQLKRSALPGKVPDTGSLNLGEIAINTYDGKVFLKKSGSIESIESIVTTNSISTGSITLTKTGSFGELVVTQDANIQRDLYVVNDIIGNGDIDVLGNITGSNLLIKGTLTAQSYIVSSSVVNMTTQFASGSTIFGNTSDDTHQFTGSVNITGSGYINSNRIITDADTGSFGSGGSSYPASGVDYDTDLVSVSDFNIESPQFLIDYLYEVPVGTEVGLKGFLGNTSGSTLVVPANDYIAFVIDDTEVARITAAGFEGASLPDGLVSGSSQLTSSYDTRYVISGSITQTTWDNIASKPSGIVSSSVQVLGGTNIISSSTQLNNATIENLTIQNLTTINETASVIYSSGSNKFGDFGDDIHQFTGSVQISGSVTTIGNINGINLTTFSSSINTTLNSLTESKVTHIVSQSGGLYYIDGVQKPSMSFVPGITYRFDTTIPDDPSHQHPFKFSTTPNGPIQYVDGVISGSNYIQLEVNYNTPEVLYYYCTLHNGMGNTINVLKIDKLLTSVSSSFDSRYVISGSITQTTWDNIASKPGGIVSGSSQVTASLDTRYALSGSTGASSVLDSRSRYLSQSTAATTWSFTHNIGSEYPMVTVYGSNNEIIQPEYVKSLSSNQTEIGFGTPVSGVAVASLGSLTEVTGRTIRQDFTSSISWSFVHNVGDKYVMVQAFDTADQMILPAEIRLASTTSSILTFTEPVSGYALATIGGDLPSISSSYEGYTLQVQGGSAVWASIVSASVSNAVSSSYILYSNVANKPTLVSGSSQLTSSYDARYVLSGSITQTTWDNIASKPSGIVSGSSQVVSILDSLNTYTASVSSASLVTSIGNLTSKTGSYATTGSNTFIGTQTLSGSIIPAIDNTYDLGSATYQWRDIYVSSGSLYIDGTKVLGSTGNELQITTDVGQSLKILEAGSDSIILQSADGNIELKSSGGGNLLFDPTNGLIDVRGTFQIQDGYKVTSSGASVIQFGNDLGITGSINTTGNVNGINLTTFSSSIASTFNTVQSNTSSITNRLNNIETFSSSVLGHITDINIKTGSFETTNTTQNTRLSRLEESTASLNSLTGSYAKTNTTNIFSGNQTITGSLFITQDLIVQGSSSIQTISSSRLDIGDNIIQLNVNNPTLRFGGLAIFDSGSAGGSGSLLYDSVEDEFVFVHKGNGTNVTSSHFVTGPETYDNLGNEIYLTINRLPKATGKEHIVDSNITDTGTLITLGSNTSVSGMLTATGLTGSIAATNGVVSGSSQITPLLPTGVVSGSAQTIANLPTGTVSGSSQVVSILSSLNTYTGSNDTTNTAQNTRLTTIESVTGSYETKGRSIVSGSSQIDVMSTTNIARLATTGSNTFTGALIGTSATFSGNGAFSGVLQVAPTQGTGIIGVGDSFGGGMNAGIYRGGIGVTTTGNYLNIGGYDGVIVTTGAAVLGAQTVRLTITAAGAAVIGNISAGATSISYVGPSQYGGIMFPRGNILFSNTNGQNQMYMVSNAYLNSGGSWAYRTASQYAGYMAIDNGSFSVALAGNSGAADSAVTWTTPISITNAGVTTFAGNVVPEANGTRDLGSSALRWSTIYTSDLSLNNGIGDWTIVEGEDDLFLYNNKKGKVYKFALTEVEPNVATPKKS